MSKFQLAWSGASLQTLRETFAEYSALNKRDKPELIRKQGKELADNLFLSTPVADSGEIRRKVKSLGWRIKRPTWDNRLRQRKIHRAMKPLLGAFLLATTYARRPENWKELTKRERKKVSKEQLRELQEAVIRIRESHRYAMRAGWIPGMQVAGSKLNVAKPRRKNLGYGVMDTNGSNPKFTIANQMPGILMVNEKHDILGKAIQRTVLNMREYIERKKLERANIWVKRKGNAERATITTR